MSKTEAFREKYRNPDGYWHKPFIEIALRGIRKAHFDFESWDIDQMPQKLDSEGFERLNDGWGVFKAPEEHTCAYITQEFASSPFTKGYWVVEHNKKKEQRWYMIEREPKIKLLSASCTPNYCIWTTGKGSDFEGEKSADMFISRIRFSDEDFNISFDEDYYPVYIEAKRATIMKGKVNLNPKEWGFESNKSKIIKDIKKMMGLYVGLSFGDVKLNHPYNLGGTKSAPDNIFYPNILFWGLEDQVKDILENLVDENNDFSIKYGDRTYVPSDFSLADKKYPYSLKNYKTDVTRDAILMVALVEFKVLGQIATRSY